MLGETAIRDYPVHCWQLPIRNIAEQLRVLRYDLGPVCTEAKMANGTWDVPERILIISNRILSPSNLSGVQQVHQCAMLETGPLFSRLVTGGIDEIDCDAARGRASGHPEATVSGGAALSEGIFRRQQGLIAEGAEVPEMMNS